METYFLQECLEKREISNIDTILNIQIDIPPIVHYQFQSRNYHYSSLINYLLFCIGFDRNLREIYEHYISTSLHKCITIETIYYMIERYHNISEAAKLFTYINFKSRGLEILKQRLNIEKYSIFLRILPLYDFNSKKIVDWETFRKLFNKSVMNKDDTFIYIDECGSIHGHNGLESINVIESHYSIAKFCHPGEAEYIVRIFPIFTYKVDFKDIAMRAINDYSLSITEKFRKWVRLVLTENKTYLKVIEQRTVEIPKRSCLFQ